MDDLLRLQRQEIEMLRERVRYLERLLVPDDVVIKPEWGLVNAERRCFAALTTRDVVKKEHLFIALYGDRLDADAPVDECVVESHISKMRKKLRRFGIKVTAQRFVGYSLLDREQFVRRAS